MKTFGRSVVVAVSLAALALGLGSRAAWAGGGPENVAVVVNADSWASQAVANEFIHLRNIPPNNVIYLSLGEVADYSTVDINYFRDKMIKPIFDTLHERKVSGQIDCLVYSTDVPNSVDFTADVGGKKLPAPWSCLTAATTGLTCVYRRTLAKNYDPDAGGYMAYDANHYARMPMRVDELGAENTRLLMKIRVLMEDGNFNGAEALMLDLLKRRPHTIMLLYVHACILIRLDKPDDAMKELTKAVNEGLVQADAIATNEALKPLAQREDFKNLIQRMRFLATRPGRPKPVEVLVKPQPSLAFRSTLTWDASGRLMELGRANPAFGETYLLSTMLAWTSGRGNSVAEAIDCLRRSAKADGTCPDGTIYFIQNSDVRAQARQGEFPSCLQLLKDLKVKAEIFKTDGAGFPEKKSIAGIMAASSDFNFTPCGSTLQPGSIAEHLTSFGGALSEDSGQTAMTDWIRAGASGTSGAVTEPWAIPAKFPMAYMHYHYAKGYCLAEAFYQSVSDPYQLLILGDPLCRPWAKIPEVRVAGVKDGDRVTGTLTLNPSVKDPKATPMGQWELFVDGKRLSVTLAGELFTLNTADLCDGYHDLRVVGLTSDETRTQGETRLTMVVNNHNRIPDSKVLGDAVIPYGQEAKVQAKAPGAKSIMLTHNGRSLATIDGESGTLKVDTRVLGTGTVTLQAIGLVDDKGGPASMRYCPPVELIVDPPPPLPAVKIDESKLAPGGRLHGLGELPRTVADKVRGDWLSKLAVKPGKDLRLMGYVTAADDAMHQFQVLCDGPCELTLDSQKLQPAGDGKGWRFFPVNLRAGPHFLVVKFTTGPNRVMNVRFGGRGTQTLSQQTFRHMPG